MSWFRKRHPQQPVADEFTAPVIVPRGMVLLAVTEECIAMKVDAMTMAKLAVGVVGSLEGRDVAKGVLDRIVAKMEGKAEAPPDPGEMNPHPLDKVVGALMDESVTAGLDLETIFMLGKGVTHRLGGEKETAKYVEKVTALMEVTQALQKLDKACR